MRNQPIKTALLAASALMALPAAAHAWTKSYVVEWAEPATYYGAKEGTLEPGTDCPAGVTEPNWVDIMSKAGYSREEAAWMINPANPTRVPGHGQNQLAFRGKDRANVYINPESIAESGALKPVTGIIGEGIDLDGDAKTGFVSPTGEKGVDNNFYKALGCWKVYRGPVRQAVGPLSKNDEMREGAFTLVLVVSGKGADPMNDKTVEVGFYDSADKMVKDGSGGVASDYTFRIRPSQKYEALFKAKTVNGRIVSTEPSKEVWLREAAYTREVQLLNAKVDLQMQKDGSLKGYLGGYRPWRSIYKSWVDARANVIETLYWVQMPDVYYALKRYADFSPAGVKGEKTHISFAMRIEALPAYVVTPDTKDEIAAIKSYRTLAKAPEPPVKATTFNVVDGVVVPKGALAVSQTPEQLKPPVQKTASAN